jgi:hypothetical protein
VSSRQRGCACALVNNLEKDLAGFDFNGEIHVKEAVEEMTHFIPETDHFPAESFSLRHQVSHGGSFL